MTTAKARISRNAGAPVTGGVVGALGDVIQLSGLDLTGWTSQLWELYGYPPGWSAPAGWTLVGTNYVSTAVAPPAFTASIWGKYMVRLTVNGGVRAGTPAADLVDETCALSVPSPSGVEDLGVRETTQFSTRGWQDAVSKIARALAAVGAPVIPDATAAVKGILRLTGSLGGTAATPTVTGIDGDGAAKATVSAKQFSVTDGTSTIDSYREKAATTNATATTILTLPIPTGAFALVDVQVVAKDASTGRRVFKLSRSCENVAGTVGSITTLGSDFSSGTGTHAVTFVASGANLLVQVAGIAATNCNWLVLADVKTST
jgi:hypothetical protein